MVALCGSLSLPELPEALDEARSLPSQPGLLAQWIGECLVP